MRLTKGQLKRIIRESIIKESMRRRVVGRAGQENLDIFQGQEHIGHIEKLESDDGQVVGYGIYLTDGRLFRTYTIRPRGQNEEFKKAVQDYEAQTVYSHSNYLDQEEALEVARSSARAKGIKLS